jgi:hypothetical protein
MLRLQPSAPNLIRLMLAEGGGDERAADNTPLVRSS